MTVTELAAGRGWRHSDPATSCTANFGGLNGAASSYTAVAGDVMVGIANISVGDINHVTPPSGSSSLWPRSGISGSNGLIAYGKAAAGGETGLTFIHSESATAMTVAALILQGALLPLAVDQSTDNPSDFASHITWPTGNIVTANAADGLISAVALSGAATSPDVDGTATPLVLAIASNSLLIAFRAVSATGTYAQTFSWVNSNFAIAGITAIKAAAAPAGTGRGKYNPGSGYVKKPSKYNPGSGYVEKPLKHHNGSAWVDLA